MAKKVFFCRERGASSFSGSIRGPTFASEKRDGECATACVWSDGAAVAGRKIERGEVVSGASDFRVRACLRGRQAYDRSGIRRREWCGGSSGGGSSAGPSEGGPGGEEVRGRDAVASGRGRSGRGYGAACSVIRSRRDAAGSSGFGRGASVRRKSVEIGGGFGSGFCGGGGPCRFSCRPMRLPRRVG